MLSKQTIQKEVKQERTNWVEGNGKNKKKKRL